MSMERRDFLCALAAGVGAVSAGVLRAAPPKHPNIVLCMADDQGWGDMAYYGHPVLKTPNFDAAAAAGLRFDRFYAAAPVCSPTRGSVLTGRHPNRFGCFSWGGCLRPQEITIAEALKKAGYVTGHFGKWHLGSVRRGSPVNPGASGFDEWFSAPNFFDNDPVMSREGKAVPVKGESSMVTVDAALEFIGKHAASPTPFLAVVWFGSPHGPHRAIERDRALYADQPKHKPDFYGEITGMDRAFGKLRKALKTLGIEQDTIVWYCSDNGGLPGLSNTGGRGHKGQIYEGGLRVPAILEWPRRLPEPRITAVPANTTDIYPTLVEITGARVDRQPPLDGISLVPLLDGKMETRPRPMGFWSHPGGSMRTPSKEWMAELYQAQQEGHEPDQPERLRLNAGDLTTHYPEHEFPGHAAWLDWPWKLHRIRKNKASAPRWELYNLETDSEEKTNLSDRESDRVATMRQGLERWLAAVVRSLNGKDYG